MDLCQRSFQQPSTTNTLNAQASTGKKCMNWLGPLDNGRSMRSEILVPSMGVLVFGQQDDFR